MSEQSDAVVIIVSEETGSISVATDGMLKRHLTLETLEKLLRNEFIPKEEKDKQSWFTTFLRGNKNEQ
jgi:diadenylate cyclase